jgi:hypothetical protein
MARSSVLFKASALVSAIVLGAALVCYRAGAFDPWLVPDTAPPDADAPTSTVDKTAGAFISSSKSIVLSSPLGEPNPTPAPQPRPKTPPPPIFMSGSKSIVLPGSAISPPAPVDSPPSGPPVAVIAPPVK